MTTRELQITKAVLGFLHSLEFGQATEVQIHAALTEDPALLPPKPGAKEVEVAIANCEANKWITGVPARHTRIKKYNINDAGEAALLELR